MSDEFRRGGFGNASPVHGEQTTLRPVEATDIDLLIDWHADPDEHTAAWVLLEFSPR